ncbi:MAG: lipid II flippase MurJ, partial [Gaiellaceae bacterium]
MDEREQRRRDRDRRRREQGKPVYFETEATHDSWPISQDPADQPTAILRPQRDRGELVELEAAAIDREGGAMQTAAAPAAERDERRPSLARSGIVFSLATALSRVLGLAREVAQSALFGVHGPINAFEIAFLVPNTVRALVADAALSSAFVPVFSDLLEKGERKRAWRVASSLFWLMLLGLGALTALFILISPWVMRAFGYGPDAYGGIAAGLARVLFPIVLVLGLTGIVVGILNSYDHFTVPALSPVFWNIAIVIGLVIGVPHAHTTNSKLYVYAASILVATFI